MNCITWPTYLGVLALALALASVACRCSERDDPPSPEEIAKVNTAFTKLRLADESDLYFSWSWLDDDKTQLKIMWPGGAYTVLGRPGVNAAIPDLSHGPWHCCPCSVGKERGDR